jgi:hypothetical protein
MTAAVKRTWGAPSSCQIQSTVEPLCLAAYTSSSCNPAYTASTPYYPPYDVRCRSFYQFGVSHGNPTQVFFQYPRVTSSGKYVVTAATPLKHNMAANGATIGGLASNVLMPTLARSISEVKILQNGYCYLIDSRNSSFIGTYVRLENWRVCLCLSLIFLQFYCMAERVSGTDSHLLSWAPVIRLICLHCTALRCSTYWPDI